MSKNSMGSPLRLDKFEKETVPYSCIKDGSKVYESFSENPYDKSDPGPSESSNHLQFKNKNTQSLYHQNYNSTPAQSNGHTLKRKNSNTKEMRRHERFKTYD